jgi:hypothetical protein
VEVDDEVVFFLGEVAALEVGAQVVDPPQPAALAAAQQPRRLGERPPAAFAVGLGGVATLGLAGAAAPARFALI